MLKTVFITVTKIAKTTSAPFINFDKKKRVNNTLCFSAFFNEVNQLKPYFFLHTVEKCSIDDLDHDRYYSKSDLKKKLYYASDS